MQIFSLMNEISNAPSEAQAGISTIGLGAVTYFFEIISIVQTLAKAVFDFTLDALAMYRSELS